MRMRFFKTIRVGLLLVFLLAVASGCSKQSATSNVNSRSVASNSEVAGANGEDLIVNKKGKIKDPNRVRDPNKVKKPGKKPKNEAK